MIELLKSLCQPARFTLDSRVVLEKLKETKKGHWKTEDKFQADGASENSMVLTDCHGQITTLMQTCSKLLDLAELYDGARADTRWVHTLTISSGVPPTFQAKLLGSPSQVDICKIQT